jgi:hypothetical protein
MVHILRILIGLVKGAKPRADLVPAFIVPKSTIKMAGLWCTDMPDIKQIQRFTANGAFKIQSFSTA